jgi:hypothetical protein
VKALPDELIAEASEVNAACIEQTGTCLTRVQEDQPAAVECRVRNGFAEVSSASTSRKGALEAIDWVRGFLPVATREDPRRIPITFWHATKRGVGSVGRMIDIVTWTEIASNYAAATKQQLSGLMSDFHPARGGQLLLFHGSAGTGKTFALRALASEWRAWCDIAYVVDPERFLGEAEYLLDVLLSRSSGRSLPRYLMDDLFGDDAPFGVDQSDASRWRLIVLEDAGELLSADARERQGQNLSRLLNTVEGLIGQGLRSLILVTTNEPIRELHPAVARAGRCAAAIEFLPLAADEASAWLAQTVDNPTTLADLYALRDGHDQARAWPEIPDEAGVRKNGTERPDLPEH